MRNFNTERLKLADAITQQQNQIDALKEDLERYKARTGASEKYIFFKEQQIKTLQAVAESFTEYADITAGIYAENRKEIAALKNKVFRLEGIILLHGINIYMYMRMSLKGLIYLVKKAYSEGWRQVPFELQEQQPIKHDPNHKKIIQQAKTLIYGKKENRQQRG